MWQSASPYAPTFFVLDSVGKTLEADRAVSTQRFRSPDRILSGAFVGEVLGEEYFGNVLAGCTVFVNECG
jgi:hypothetical protein